MTPEQRFEENYYLVSYIFQKYFKQYLGTQYYDDIMQEGYLALWRSCMSFNESLGYQFSTYAGASIRFGMIGHIRREDKVSNRIASIYEVIADDGEGEEIYIIDALSTTPDISFTKEVVDLCIRELCELDQKIVQAILSEHTQREAADMCNTSQATVSRCLRRFRKLVAKGMEN